MRHVSRKSTDLATPDVEDAKKRLAGVKE